MFLGGVGEVGKNMMALEYGNDIIIIDCGATFPSDDMPGIDLVVPDITYLKANKDKIKGIVLTHGHEDHIGAIPFVLNDIHTPIYGSRLALGLVENKLKEYPKIKAKFVSVKERQTINLGCFTIEFIHVNHSIPGAMALAITTPVGLMLHTGDFKIDFESMDGKVTDLSRFAELGKKGVLLLTCESTNVEKEGYSMSEKRVAQSLDNLFGKFLDKRLFVASFASNVLRLQQILDLAEKYGRKVVFTGRSMLNVAETAYKIGELKFNKNNIIDIDKIGGYQDSELLIITTGSQGEPMSALTRMANGDFQKIKLDSNDVIIMSAAPIPGNEKNVNSVMNNLYKLGCEIIYHSLAEIHASGHAYKEELKIIHNLVKPKYFLPVHGEFRHQKFHKDLAVNLGMPEKNIILAENGNKIEVNKNVFKLSTNIIAGERLVDGNGMGDIESVVLRDRKQLAEEGVLVSIIALDKFTGELLNEPEIISRGLIYNNEAQKLVVEARNVIKEALDAVNIMENDLSSVKNNVRKHLANFFFKKMKRRPMILTIIVEN
ncbi:MAG: ribonuclease J [Clostridiales bacterium]|nr:ribonuclease J [Clostridiales bacterium]